MYLWLLTSELALNNTCRLPVPHHLNTSRYYVWTPGTGYLIMSSKSPLKIGHGPFHTYLFLFENGEIGLPSARIRWKRSPKLQKCVISRQFSRVEIFEKGVLMLYSCGWMKTQPYRILTGWRLRHGVGSQYVRMLQSKMVSVYFTSVYSHFLWTT